MVGNAQNNYYTRSNVDAILNINSNLTIIPIVFFTLYIIIVLSPNSN